MKLWLKAAAIRAVKTMAQAAIAIIGTATVMQEIDWPFCASAVAVSGILSILTSIAGLPEVPSGTGDPDEIEDGEDE